MSTTGRARAWLRAVLLHRRVGREMREEMEAHIEQAAERLMARGLSRPDALQAARREFGVGSVLQEEGRDARGGRWVGILASDIRYAFRHFSRTRLVTLTSVLILTIGVIVNAAVFTFVDGAFNRPAPGVPNDPALVMIRGEGIDKGRRVSRALSYPEMADYAGLHDVFQSVAGWTSEDVIVDLGGAAAGPATARVQFVTPNFFQTVGRPLAAGTGFVATRFDDHRQLELSAVVSHTFADEKFGGASQATGKQFRMNGFVVRVVGVAPPRFNGVTPAEIRRMIWMPLSAWRTVGRVEGDPFTNHAGAHFWAFGRLRRGVSRGDAQVTVSAAASRTIASMTVARGASQSRAPEETFIPQSPSVVPLHGEAANVSRSSDVVPLTAALAAITMLILLVCTATVASLLIAAGVKRRNEIGVRLALGASRGRILRQLLTESSIMSAVAAALGFLAFMVLSRIFAHRMEGVDITAGWRTAAFTAAIAMLASILCGLSPALHATRNALSAVLKDSAAGATSRSKLQPTFVVAQIALTQPLLVCLAMLVSFVVNGLDAKPGTRIADRVVIAEFETDGDRPASNAQLLAVKRRLEALPGVRAVLAHPGSYWLYTLEYPATGAVASASGGPSTPRPLEVRALGVGAGYFEALEVPLLRGREFRNGDEKTSALSPIMIASDFAEELFPGVNPVGRRLYRLRDAKRDGEVEIVGVVDADLVGRSDDRQARRIFAPGGDWVERTLLIRTDGQAEPLLPAMRTAIQSEARLLPIRSLRTMAQVAQSERSIMLQATSAATGAGMLVMLLACIGLYAVVALNVSQRRREIGIRIAIGGRPLGVASLYFGRGVRLALLGIVIGLPIGIAALRFLAMEVGMPRANFALIGVIVAAIVVGVASFASWLPARRAAEVDPVIALRSN